MNHCHKRCRRNPSRSEWLAKWLAKNVGEDQREEAGDVFRREHCLPKTKNEVAAFESEVKAANEAGATVLRTVCLSWTVAMKTSICSEFQHSKQRDGLHSFGYSYHWKVLKSKLAIENHKTESSELGSYCYEILHHEWLGSNRLILGIHGFLDRKIPNEVN